MDDVDGTVGALGAHGRRFVTGAGGVHTRGGDRADASCFRSAVLPASATHGSKHAGAGSRGVLGAGAVSARYHHDCRTWTAEHCGEISFPARLRAGALPRMGKSASGSFYGCD